MAIKFENKLKGRITQSLLSDLLTSSGYRVVPLGVEQVVLEVQNLPQDQYLKLELPKNLRTLPDFFITDDDLSASIMLEVKYRKSWNKRARQSLTRTLDEQAKFWQPFYVAFFLGEPERKATSHDDYMRIAKLEKMGGVLTHRVDKPGQVSRHQPFEDVEWADLWTFEETFGNITKHNQQQNLMKVARLVSALPHLDQDDS